MEIKNNKKINNRGGNRNYNNKATTHIEERKIVALLKATNIAFDRNIAFNCFVTINFGNIGLKKIWDDYNKTLSKFHSLICRFYRHKTTEPTYLYVRENTYHEHVHYLFYIHPDDIKKFKMHIKKSLKATFGKPKNNDIKYERITGSENIKHYPEVYRENLKRILAYVLKCVEINVAERLGITAQNINLVHDNFIVGKRTGFSKNISPNSNFPEKPFLSDLRPETDSTTPREPTRLNIALNTRFLTLYGAMRNIARLL